MSILQPLSSATILQPLPISSMPKTRGSCHGARTGTGGRTGRGDRPVSSRRRLRELQTAGVSGSSVAPSTSIPNTNDASPASLSVRTIPSTAQWPGASAVPQFLEMICEEVRQQLAAQSGSTSATSLFLPTSLVPTPLDAAGTEEPGMVLLLHTGACSCNVERTRYGVCSLNAVHGCSLS